MEKQFIGLFFCAREQIKPEYLIENLDKEYPLIFVEIYKDRKYGAIAKIKDGKTAMENMFKGVGKSKKKIDWDKPVDTSKWVKPDEESIRNALVTELFATIILKEESINYPHHHTKMEVLYSILHSHSPKNPQTLSNFAVFWPVQSILSEFKVQEAKKPYEILFGKDGKSIFREEAYAEVEIWRTNILKKMISNEKTPMT